MRERQTVRERESEIEVWPAAAGGDSGDRAMEDWRWSAELAEAGVARARAAVEFEGDAVEAAKA